MISPQQAVVNIMRGLGVEGEIAFNTPPRPEMGDFSTPVALRLAKSRKVKPLEVAQELHESLSASLPPYIRSVAVTPPGFLNFFLDDRHYMTDLLAAVVEQGDDFGSSSHTSDKLDGRAGERESGRGDESEHPTPNTQHPKVLVEHTNVNPNKAMHVGHVRNAVLGDTVVRALRRAGYPVEACNYIDDTGVQVVDVVTAMLYLDEPRYTSGNDFDSVWAKVDSSQSFDYFCWDLYARVQEYLSPDAEKESPDETHRSRVREMKRLKEGVMHAMEERDHPLAHFAKDLSSRIVRKHLASAARMNVFYDLLNWESDILGEGFWQRTFDRLRESGVIRFEERGLNRGCWIVPLGGIEETPDGPRSLDKILVRSNGAPTYTAKDIAYQLWKFGRLDADFKFKLWSDQANGEPLWTTAPDGQSNEGFGHAGRVINVIDQRQSEPQTTVYQCLEGLGFVEEAKNSVHLGYQIVKLTPAAARELGVQGEDTEDVAMSGRRGVGVKADDLMDRMMAVVREAALKTKNANPDLNAEALAAAAIRYYMLRFSTNTIIRFDFDVASQTQGDTGVYLAYSYARACTILGKAAVMDGESGRVGERESGGAGERESGGAGESPNTEHPSTPPPLHPSTPLSPSTPLDLTLEEKALAWEMGRLPEVILQAAESLTTTILTTYIYALASAFARFWDHTPPILKEPDPETRAFRLTLIAAFRQVMKNTLDVLGLPALERI
ncbi:MAG: arginine--tRNA ligase [Armatimonadota bacterium]|nr:arginine--tRNA ligase [Armatimonadota bacterium]